MLFVVWFIFYYLFIDYIIKINGGKYYGDVIVNYMGVNGCICWDGWDDKDV